MSRPMTIPQLFICRAKHIRARACSVVSAVRRKGQLFSVSGPLRVMLLIVVFQLAACDVRTTKSPEDFPALHTVASVDSGILAGGVSLVSFGGKNCGPCKKMRGILHDLKGKTRTSHCVSVLGGRSGGLRALSHWCYSGADRVWKRWFGTESASRDLEQGRYSAGNSECSLNGVVR